jgi:hypothetical protein
VSAGLTASKVSFNQSDVMLIQLAIGIGSKGFIGDVH